MKKNKYIKRIMSMKKEWCEKIKETIVNKQSYPLGDIVSPWH